MACRKAADRALTEVAEWKARQDERTASAWRRMEQRVKPKWVIGAGIDGEGCAAAPNGIAVNSSASMDSTSATVLSESSSSVLCYSWLEDGWERGPACGCNGGCGKEHPRIVLTFNGAVDDGDDDDAKGAVATLSHPLKPFTDYFDNLCTTNLAYTTKKRTTYRLHGFLQEHLGRLEAQRGFGHHLVKVTTEALTASRRAQEAYQKACDEAEQKAIASSNKKRKRNHSRGCSSSQVDSKGLMEQAFDVVWDNNWFQDNLDLLDIHYWRMSGIVNSGGANRLAQERLQALRLAFRVLLERGTVAGMPQERRPQTSGLNYEVLTTMSPSGCVTVNMRHPEGYTSLTGLLSQCRLHMVSQRDTGGSVWAQSSNENGEPEIGSYPCVLVDEIQGTATTVASASSAQRSKTPQTGGSNTKEVDNNQLDSQVALIIQVFMEGYDSMERSLAQRLLMKHESDVLGSLLEVVRYRVERHRRIDDRLDCSFSRCDGNLGLVLNIKSLSISFEDLVSYYVRRKLFVSRAALRKIQYERPASRAEKDYVRRWARAAREHVPGHARDFEGLQGWDVDTSKTTPIHLS